LVLQGFALVFRSFAGESVADGPKNENNACIPDGAVATLRWKTGGARMAASSFSHDIPKEKL
jgi:hypothetical protein